ncbi:MAG: hypothetical protein IKW77_10880 [Salinivirgaceae bacterium]|nr:hypothetical protein [Salinivirgaceae bacterium]
MAMNKILSTTMLVMFAIMFVTCNKEKEIVIKNTANPKYDIGTAVLNAGKKQTIHINDIYSLWPDEVGKIKQDSVIPTNLKAFTISKDGLALCEFMERNYRNNVPHIKVFDKEINLNPYLRGISCEYIQLHRPYSYNDLIFYTLGVIGKKGKDNKYFSLPIILMINLDTKECTVVGRGFYIDGVNDQNMAIIDGIYLGILDFYMDSYESVVKYYTNKKGNYVGWSPNVNLVNTKTKRQYIYNTPLKNINTDWHFTYGNDKYGRPISMEKGNEKYVVKYSNSGYLVTRYDMGQKKYVFEPYDVNELFDLRTWDRVVKNRGKLTHYNRLTSIVRNNEKYEAVYTTTGYRLKGYDDKGRIKFEYENNNDGDFDLEYWDLNIPKRGKLIEYSYSSSGTLDTKKYYNESRSYYLREIQLSDGRFSCRGIYENSGEFIDDVLIDASYEWGVFYDNYYIIYRNDPKTGIKTKITELSEKQIKGWLLDYLYNLN